MSRAHTFKREFKMKANEFIKWYASRKDSHVSHAKASKVLDAMGGADKRIVQRIVDDMMDDLARDRKRQICRTQLFEGEQLRVW